MSGLPENVLQFRAERMTVKEHLQIRAYYFGECGDGQGFWPSRHRWDRHPEIADEQICRHCALTRRDTLEASEAVLRSET